MSAEVAPPSATTDRTAWRSYWATNGMPWRTEPEIDEQRQRYLAERRAVPPNPEAGIYPFRTADGAIKGLTRADLEWLLATHENNGKTGPVLWEEERAKPLAEMRLGLDLRGADLRGLDLSHLPLARLCAGMEVKAWLDLAPEQAALAELHCEGANLTGTHLEGARLSWARFDDAILRQAHLVCSDLTRVHLEGANVVQAEVAGADLRWSFLDRATSISRLEFFADGYGPPRLADVRWGEVNLPVTSWLDQRRRGLFRRNRAVMLGDERIARSRLDDAGNVQKRSDRQHRYEAAVRAYRQIASVLRTQGFNEGADGLAYRAQRLQRKVLRGQGRPLAAFGSWLLDLVSGYGYRPIRSLVAYLLITCLFAGAYLLNAQFAAPHLTWDESLVLSISAFHGRGFFTSGINLGDTLARLAAGEAIIGLLIEITFIATFTNRFFAR